MNARTSLLVLAAAALAGCAPTATRGGGGAPITDAESLIRAMHGRYAGKWYRTLSFSQQTTRVNAAGQSSTETWVEYGAMPGRLRIEMGPPEERRGAIYANDSVYVIRGGQVASRQGRMNELMTLGFDVYAQAPEVTLRQLRQQGFTLAPFRTDTWQGRPAYVVGGAPGDLKTKQFWVDAERLVFVRFTEAIPNDTTRFQDVRFNSYQPLGGGWIAPEVEVVVDGRRVFHEVYSDIRIDMPLDPSLFIPERWNDAVKPSAR